MLELDHLFIGCTTGAPEAQALLDAGFREGSPNTHPGQGTANRRFFFAEFYLELIWIADPAAVRSDAARPTRLGERLSGAQACPFGLLYRRGNAQASPPFATWPYRPSYLPAGASIEFAIGTPLTEPELLFLPFVRRTRTPESEPTTHALPLQAFRGVTVGLPSVQSLSPAALGAQQAGLLRYRGVPAYAIELEFASPRDLLLDLRPRLPLLIRGVAATG